jgi:hypothetical protein
MIKIRGSGKKIPLKTKRGGRNHNTPFKICDGHNC